jgi:hypothetical protein
MRLIILGILALLTDVVLIISISKQAAPLAEVGRFTLIIITIVLVLCGIGCILIGGIEYVMKQDEEEHKYPRP